jgi:micrococcal nuclease
MRGRRSPILIAVLLVAGLLAGWLVPMVREPAEDATRAVVAGPATVVDVVDGDTVRVRLANGAEETVRVVGIDTPEIAHGDEAAACHGEEAAAATRAWLLDRVVELRPAREQRDRYGRLLARLTPVDGPLADRDLSRALALSGLARELAIAPNVDDAPAIAERVRIARREGRGLWGACGFAAAFPGKNPSGSG